MTQVQNKFFPPPPQSGEDTLPYGDPEENEGRESEEISIRKRGAVKSDWSKGRRHRRRKRLIDYDPSLDYEMIGPAISQFTGFNDGKRWHAMTIPSTVPPGFLSNSTPAPYQGASGSGHAIGTGQTRRSILREQRNAATVARLLGQNVDLVPQKYFLDDYNTDQLLEAAKKAVHDGAPAASDVKEAIRVARKKGANAISKGALADLIRGHDPIYEAVMRNLEDIVPPQRGRPRLEWQRSATDFFDSNSRLTTPPRPPLFSTDPINAPTSTDDAIPREQMAQSEAQRGVRDSAVNPELTPHHGRDFRPPREEKASGRMPAHMQYEGGGRGGEGYRDAGNRRR